MIYNWQISILQDCYLVSCFSFLSCCVSFLSHNCWCRRQSYTFLVPLLRDCFRNICFHTLEKIETHLFFSLPPERASDVQTKTLGFWCRGSIFHWQHNQSIDQPSNLDWSLAKPQPSYPTKVGPQLTTAKDNNIGVLVTWIYLSHRSPAVPNHRPTEQIRLVSRQTKPYTSNPTKNLPIQRQIYTKQRLYIC